MLSAHGVHHEIFWQGGHPSNYDETLRGAERVPKTGPMILRQEYLKIYLSS